MTELATLRERLVAATVPPARIAWSQMCRAFAGLPDRGYRAGNSVVVIEHDLDVIKTADYIIDLGPEGGVKGGEIVATGTPEQVVKEPRSYTGRYLKPLLEKGSAGAKAVETAE